MSVESIIAELEDVERALEEIEESYDIVNKRFSRARDLSRFQARKNQYKALRDDAERWLKNHGFKLQDNETLERGWYHDDAYFHDTLADNPFRWALQAFRVRRELEEALEQTFVPQNLYLVRVG
jgi:hypothetical protein